MARLMVILAPLLGGCTLILGVEDPVAIDAAPADAPGGDASPADDDVAHLSGKAEQPGTADLVFDDNTTIDTTMLSTGSAIPDGVWFDVVAQEGGGPELAVLHVADLRIAGDATVRAVGARPLVVVAGGDIVIAGILDAGAQGNLPGAGGAAPGQGPGAGKAGEANVESSSGGGAGGGGFGRAGARGGSAGGFDGGPPGAVYRDDRLEILQGGSGGGAQPDCMSVAGAGGGAVQLFAMKSIMVTGVISAGGGGGRGGFSGCTAFASGTGGGSGGAIYLQTPGQATIDGVLVVNGGGGGGGSGASGPGKPGGDGPLASVRAPGGGGAGSGSSDGGAGGASVGDAEHGADMTMICDGCSAGGGGGGVGRIVVRARSAK